MLMRALITPSANKLVDNHKLNLCQYAWRKATTMAALTEKRLLLESSRLSRKDYIWLVSDMTAYYDRHISEIGEIMLTSHGVNKNGAATLMQTLREMETHVQTAYVTSKIGHRSTEEAAHYGTGQGNILSILVC